jgi:3-deoxy-D-manno-octulosonate 8-phosphate phosphatase (KDO 8-P phosphatase)
MSLCGFVECPANACAEVKTVSNYVAKANGGHSAVREILEYLLAMQT